MYPERDYHVQVHLRPSIMHIRNIHCTVHVHTTIQYINFSTVIMIGTKLITRWSTIHFDNFGNYFRWDVLYVRLALFRGQLLPESSYSILQLSNCPGSNSASQVLLHCSPNVFNWVQVRARCRCFEPYNVLVLKVLLCPSTRMLRIVVLLEPVIAAILTSDKR